MDNGTHTEHHQQPVSKTEEVKFWQHGYFPIEGLSPGLEPYAQYRLASPEKTHLMVENTKRLMGDATKILGDLHLDDEGLSRADILKAESNTKLSQHDKQVLDALLTLGQRPGETWSSGSHPAHLEEQRQAASNMPKPGHGEPTVKQQERLDQANKALKNDWKAQYDHYMNDALLTPASVARLKSNVDKGEVAANILADSNKSVDSLMETLHLGKNDTLNPSLVWSTLADKEAMSKLTADQRQQLIIVQSAQRTMFQQLASGDAQRPDGHHVSNEKDICFDHEQLRAAVTTWALGLASTPSLADLATAESTGHVKTLTQSEFRQEMKRDDKYLTLAPADSTGDSRASASAADVPSLRSPSGLTN